MQTAADNHESAVPWQIQPGTPPSLGEVVAIVSRAVENQKERGPSAFPITQALPFLDDAEKLTYERSNSASWIRRVARKQGRIDRRLREALEAILCHLGGRSGLPGRGNLKAVRAEIDQVADLMHGEKGHPLLRRIRRPQCAINEHLSRAVKILAEWSVDPERGFLGEGEADTRLRNDILWHANEAAHFAGRHHGHSVFIRRMKTDQFQIDRCLVIALRLMVGAYTEK